MQEVKIGGQKLQSSAKLREKLWFYSTESSFIPYKWCPLYPLQSMHCAWNANIERFIQKLRVLYINDLQEFPLHKKTVNFIADNSFLYCFEGSPLGNI